MAVDISDLQKMFKNMTLGAEAALYVGRVKTKTKKIIPLTEIRTLLGAFSLSRCYLV